MSRQITIYINDDIMYLLVSQGDSLKKWASTSLEADLVSGGMVQQPEEVAARLKELMKTVDIRGGKVNICLSGLKTMTRPLSLPKVSAKVLPEVLQNEARQAMPVPLEDYYMSWEVLATHSDRIDVFVVAIARDTADTLLAAVRTAGLSPGRMELKPLALSLAAPADTAIIVDVQASEFDIVIKANGLPQPLRTLPLDEEEPSLEERQPLIRDDVLRTIQFYNDNNPENMLDEQVPFYVSGLLAGNTELMDILAADTGYKVERLPLPLECPEEMNPDLYSGGIAMAAGNKLAAEAGKTTPRLNVLPPAYLPKPISLARVMVLPGLVLAAVLFGFAGLQYLGLSGAVTTLSDQLENTNKLLLERKIEAKRLNNDITAMGTQTATVQADIDALADLATSLKTQHTFTNNNLGFSLDYLPGDVHLERLSITENSMTVTGWGEDEDTIIYYGNRLDDAIPSCEVIVSSLMRRDTGTMGDFSLVLRPRE